MYRERIGWIAPAGYNLAINSCDKGVPVHEMRPSQAAGSKSEEKCSVWCKHREASAAHRKAVEDELYLQYRAHDS